MNPTSPEVSLALNFTASTNRPTIDQSALATAFIKRKLGNDCLDILEALELTP